MTTKQLTLTALFVALGIVLPQSIHFFGGPNLGVILLPMHFPVFIGAMLLGPRSGVIIAVLSVSLGMLLGMPILIVGLYMLFELSVYALVSGYLYFNKKTNIYFSFVVAKLLGMMVAILVTWIMFNWLGINQIPVFGSITMFTPSIPGIIAQLVIIPPTVYLLKQSGVYHAEV